MKGIITKSAKREFTCQLLENNQIIQATALGMLLKNEQTLVVGDKVHLEQDGGGNYTIYERAERASQIERYIPREKKMGVIAANCDVIVILMSVSRPEYKRGLVDRYLVRAAQWELPALLVFNKMDEHDPQNVDIKFEADRLASLGVDAYELCATDLSYRPKYLALGFEALKQALKGKLSILLGQSGVGKSKTISALSNGVVDLQSGDIGKLGKGAHTTTWAEILDCGDFQLIDSPGIRSYSLEDLDPAGLPALFPDLFVFFQHCQFNNCQHLETTKGCAFYKHNYANETHQAAVFSRLEQYQKILDEISKVPQWKK